MTINGVLLAMLSAVLLRFLGMWLSFQAMKDGTVIPVGHLPKRCGVEIWSTLQALSIGFVIAAAWGYDWKMLFSIPLVWFAGGWMAAVFERVGYASSQLKALPEVLNGLIRLHGQDRALQMWPDLVPRWWLDLMSPSWRQQYESAIKELLNGR